ncbi:MAG: ABC transporter permease [Flavitalea sp.]
MKPFLSLIKKELRHIFRDRRTMFILLGMPVIQIILFGFALTNEVKNAKIAVFDQANDTYSKSLIAQLNSSAYFDVQQTLHSYNDIQTGFQRGEVKLAIIFPADFQDNLIHFNTAQVQLIADASDPNTASALVNYATAVILDYQQRITNNRKLPYTIKTEVRMLYNPQLKGAYSMVPGVMAMVLMLVCTMMTAITIVREKESGTMEVLLVSPVQPIKIVVAKAVPYLLLSIINITTIILLSLFVLEVPINGSIVLLMLESILFTLTCLSLGLLISASTDSQQTAILISLTGMFLPTIMLSGFMFPIENMPLPLRILSNVVPAKWFYSIVTSVMIKGAGFKIVWKETLMLFGMMLFFLSLAIKKFKIRLA